MLHSLSLITSLTCIYDEEVIINEMLNAKVNEVLYTTKNTTFSLSNFFNANTSAPSHNCPVTAGVSGLP